MKNKKYEVSTAIYGENKYKNKQTNVYVGDKMLSSICHSGVDSGCLGNATTYKICSGFASILCLQYNGTA